ncbi:MAG: hypothetical protein KAT48_01720 [Bacteroidales bacterium]|nr:hypothetical protein [Bacteroidales bacterium]
MAKAKTSKSTSTAAKTKTTKTAAKKKVKASVEVSKAKKKKEEVQEESTDVSIEQKLIALYTLQQIDSQVDKIRIIRGELPLEVQDLEDEIVGLETRLENYRQGIESYEKSISEKQQAIKESEALITRYKEQQMNVRNNREYDSLTKEIEFQILEIQLSEKRISEFTVSFEATKTDVEDAESTLSERKNDLEIKKGELDDIVAETEKEEERLVDKSDENEKFIEDRLLKAYKRIRKNARNGLAVVQIERDACGGCFSKIPPQRHLDIRMHKKIIVCEYCGRILVDSSIAEEVKY